MDKLACIQAIPQAEKIGALPDPHPLGWQQALVELGAELLDGSGFENEQSQPDFEEEEVS